MSHAHNMSETSNKDRRGHGRKREIRILQHNMQRSKTVPYEIRTQMSVYDYNIITMQELYSIEGKIPGLGTGVAIACIGSKQDLPMAAVGRIKSEVITPLEVAELCTTHCAYLQISDGEIELYIVNQKFPPTENIEVGIQQLDKVLKSVKGKKIIISLDGNVKSPLWGSRSTNDRGEALQAVIAQYDLHVLNQPGQSYTFETTRERSNIDVTMASPEAIPLVKE